MMTRSRLSVISTIFIIVSSMVFGCSTSETKGTEGHARSFSVAAFSQGRQVGDLVLGQTTLKQALKILPAFPDHPPSPIGKIEQEHTGKVRAALEKAKLGYNPMWSPNILIFDNNDRLIIVQTNFDDVGEGKKIYEKYKPQLKLVSKPSQEDILPLSRMQGDIEPCVTLEVFVRETGEVNGVGYIYTCPTEQR